MKATKAELERVARSLANVLRMQAQFNDKPDAENCWCAGKHFNSSACAEARHVLKRWRQIAGDKR